MAKNAVGPAGDAVADVTRQRTDELEALALLGVAGGEVWLLIDRQFGFALALGLPVAFLLLLLAHADLLTRRKWILTSLGGVAAVLITGLVAPYILARIALVTSDRQKETDLRVGLISKIDQSLTATVTESRLLADGLLGANTPATGGPITDRAKGVPSASTAATAPFATEYEATLTSWLDQSSEVGDEINTYYGTCPAHSGGPTTPTETSPLWTPLGPNALMIDRVRCNWLPLFSVVTDFLRRSASIEPLDRNATGQEMQTFMSSMFPKDQRVAQIVWSDATIPVVSAQQISDLLLLARDQLVNDIRATTAFGFQTRYKFLDALPQP
jgi:hypothetical protein